MVRKTDTSFWTIFIETCTCVPLFFSSQKLAYHYFSRLKYWYARWWRCLRLVTLFTANFYSGGRCSIEKTSGSGTTSFLDYLQFWRTIFEHFCIFWNFAPAKRFRSWKAIFWRTDFCYLRLIFSRKDSLSMVFVQRKSAASREDHPRWEGNRTQREPWAQALTGKNK